MPDRTCNPKGIKKICLNIGIGRIAPGSFYRREIEWRVNVAMCEKHYYDKDLTGGTDPLPISRENHIFGFSGPETPLMAQKSVESTFIWRSSRIQFPRRVRS